MLQAHVVVNTHTQAPARTTVSICTPETPATALACEEGASVTPVAAKEAAEAAPAPPQQNIPGVQVLHTSLRLTSLPARALVWRPPQGCCAYFA